MIREETLQAEVERAQKQYRTMVAQLDAWEARHQSTVHLLPWYEARQAWERAGRPEPEWYELLFRDQDPQVAIKKGEISHQLLAQYRRPWDAPTPKGMGRPEPTQNGKSGPRKKTAS